MAPSIQEFVAKTIDRAPLNRGIAGRDWLSTTGNIAIVLGDDVALFEDEGDGAYECHLLFESRGKEAIATAREAFDRMFKLHGATVIFGLISDMRPEAKVVARRCGAKSRGTRYTVDGFCELFVLTPAGLKGPKS